MAQRDRSELVQYVEMTLENRGHVISEQPEKTLQDSAVKPDSTESSVTVLQIEMNGKKLLIESRKSDMSKIPSEKHLHESATEDIESRFSYNTEIQ